MKGITDIPPTSAYKNDVNDVVDAIALRFIRGICIISCAEKPNAEHEMRREKRASSISSSQKIVSPPQLTRRHVSGTQITPTSNGKGS
jgi:hypothetical protein